MSALPISGWRRMIRHSSAVSGPGLRRIASGMPILPMSWSSTPWPRSGSSSSDMPCSREVARGLDHAALEQFLVVAPLDQELAALERALGGDQQLVHVDGLHDEVVRDELQAVDRGLDVGGAGQHDHRRVAVGAPDLAQQLDAGHHGHLEVGHDQGRAGRAEHLEALTAVVGEQAVVARPEEDLVEDLPDLAVIVDDQDVPLRAAPPTLVLCPAATTWFLPA